MLNVCEGVLGIALLGWVYPLKLELLKYDVEAIPMTSGARC